MSEIAKREEFDSAEQFLNALSPTSDYFREIGQGGSYSNSRNVILFRGHSNSSYSLVPSALRLSNNGLKIFTGKEALPSNVKEQTQTEIDLLVRFVIVADFAGLLLPEDTQKFRLKLHHVKASAHHEAYIGKTVVLWPHSEILSSLAIGQHNGLPTRLLDWTRSPFVAAYFAASEAAKRRADFKEKNNGEIPHELLSVWAFDHTRYRELTIYPSGIAVDPETVKLVHVVTAPRATNANLHAQDGVFTLYRSPRVNPNEEPDRRSLILQIEESLRSTSENFMTPLLVEFTLPIELAYKLLQLLSRIGVNAARLFPGYAGAVRAVREGE